MPICMCTMAALTRKNKGVLHLLQLFDPNVCQVTVASVFWLSEVSEMYSYLLQMLIQHINIPLRWQYYFNLNENKSYPFDKALNNMHHVPVFNIVYGLRVKWVWVVSLQIIYKCIIVVSELHERFILKLRCSFS